MDQFSVQNLGQITAQINTPALLIYLHAYESLTQAHAGLKNYFQFYNAKRKHQTLNAKPDEVYYADLPPLKQVI